jgi:hypothetical protein
LLNKIKEEAQKEGLSLGQFCRQKFRKHDQLDRIEGKLDKVLKRR